MQKPGRVVLHVGLTKTGTTWLQGLLAGQRERLVEHGVRYPYVRPGAQFEGAVEVRGSETRFGLDPDRVRGTWAAVCGRAREAAAMGETVLLSHEVLAGATPGQVRWALEPLAGLDVRVLVTARDLGRQAVAHWQERVKLGDPRSFAAFADEELRADTGPDPRGLGPDDGGVRPRFWHGQDLADTLARWTGPLGAGTGGLVVCPAPGAPRAELWRRFATAAGVPTSALDPTAEVPGNASLGAGEVALLREVNARLADRLDARTYHAVVKRGFAENDLAARRGAAGWSAVMTPADLGPLLGGATLGWIEAVRAAGHPVHGEVTDLDPVLAEPGAPGPDATVPPDLDVDAIVADLLRRAETHRAPPRRPTLLDRLRRR
ncbi:serine/threonine-protein kinase [Nocardioides acrostichi]|uniref:Sulfotransferase family protein n=1 Tax=Nocardioides acrostichi TaxID=2784339 RepID=A0A930UW01_9ACTN|nr:hypothetical protein [Nocardioides acrostichi]MBF4161883.1 hypothetical protein [Nocardioides acrostichi]